MISNEMLRYHARVDWQGFASIDSDSPTVLTLAATLNLTEPDLQAQVENPG